jgi:hypothetical protein
VGFDDVKIRSYCAHLAKEERRKKRRDRFLRLEDYDECHNPIFEVADLSVLSGLFIKREKWQPVA